MSEKNSITLKRINDVYSDLFSVSSDLIFKKKSLSYIDMYVSMNGKNEIFVKSFSYDSNFANILEQKFEKLGLSFKSLLQR